MATGTIQKLMPTDIGVVRPNLLDNWYFVGGGSQQGAGYFPINSKGQTSYSIPAARTPCIDRWYGYDGQGSGSIQIVSGGVQLTKSTNADGIYWGQSGVYEDLTGKTVTLSILTSTGALYSGTATVPQGYIISAYPNFSAGVTIESGKLNVQFYSYASTVTVVAAKLELGDSQTLAHQVNGSWVLNEVPNYAEELVKIEKANSQYASNYAHIESNAAHTIRLSNPYHSFIIQHAHIALTLVVAQNGSAPILSDVYGTHTFTMTASGNNLVFTGGSSGAQYNLYSGEPFYVD